MAIGTQGQRGPCVSPGREARGSGRPSVCVFVYEGHCTFDLE